MKWCKCLSCKETEVEEIATLDFSCSSLTEVPAIVFNFERTLQYLHLDCNKIAELPRTLFQCEELRYLGLCDNEIEIIPPLIEKLNNLESLLLNRNCLTCHSIPSNIHRCQALRVLHLSSNGLSKIPISVTRLIGLRELYLNNCDLDFLPANFGRLSNLRVLELRENNLRTLPKSLKRLSDLQRLDISSNTFSKIPEVIGTMTNVTELWINDNFISDVPDCIGNLHKLMHFDVSSNKIEKITDNIGSCINMNLLVISANDLKKLPDSIGNLTALHTFKADHNLLQSLPQTIGKLSNLEDLDVQYNVLTSLPSSIGTLRKLNSLVAAQNSICQLPIEIGSCTALSILTLHCNALSYIPEEIGHLQNLTSISLINNRLEHLPITILGLQKLKALWLSHNQSQPLVTLQTEVLEFGHVVLTCVFLPQIEDRIKIYKPIQPSGSSGRRIGFMEPNLSTDLPAKLNRIPTPHPKAFVKYQRTLGNSLRRNQENIAQNITVDPVYVKEASIVPMKNNVEDSESKSSPNKIVNEELSTSHYDVIQDNGNNNDRGLEVNVESGRTSSSIENGMINLQIDKKVDIKQKNTVNGTKPKQPPPYHIAAVYSRGAHFFLNTAQKSEKEAEPKHFTQDKPSNILNPQPKHARCITQFQHETECVYNDNFQLNEKILTVTAGLLKINTLDHHHLTEKFVQFHIINDKCFPNNVLEAKLQILKTALYLLSHQDTHHIQNENLIPILNQLEETLKLIKSNSVYEYENCDKQMQEKLDIIDIISSFLFGYNENEKLYDLLNRVLFVENIMSKDYLLLYEFPNIKYVIEKNSILQVKLRLIRIIVYFLSFSEKDEQYALILNIFMQFQKGLQNRYEELGNQRTQHFDNLTLSKSDQKQSINWLFGVHRNPKIMKVELTPCCYVLGFTVTHTKDGVFVDEIDQNGNAFQKLFTGDKILMLDDRDISKLDSEEAVKAVQVWGPETETFLISRL